MATYAETIAALRAERETKNEEAQRLREECASLSVQIAALERAITPPKQGHAKPDDIVMPAEPAVTTLRT